jgi:hypothetical protein
MLKLMIPLRRPRVTITGLMSVVVFCALLLGCIIEMRRIMRAQLFFGQMAANYAQREKFERDSIAFDLDLALVHKRIAESQRESIERQADRAGRHLGDVNDALLQSRIRLYESRIDSGRRNLMQVREARIKAERFAILKQIYADAASCLWLPFAPSPLAVRHPENGGRAGKVSRHWTADEADAAEDLFKGMDEIEKPAKPDVRKKGPLGLQLGGAQVTPGSARERERQRWANDGKLKREARAF